MNVFDLFGLPDVHELADRVLSGDVSTIRTAASTARGAGERLGAQADTLARERVPYPQGAPDGGLTLPRAAQVS